MSRYAACSDHWSRLGHCVVLIIVAGIVFLLGAPASADEPVYSSECKFVGGNTPAGWPYVDEDRNPTRGEGHLTYYIHDDFARKLRGCTPTSEDDTELQGHHARGVIRHAAEIWNTQTRGTPFVHGGGVDNETAEEFCEEGNFDSPAVYIDFREGCRFQDKSMYARCNHHGGTCDDVGASDCTGAWATIRQVCDDVVEVIFMGDPESVNECDHDNGRPLNWNLNDLDPDVGSSSGDDISLLSVAIHELGHTLNLDHPDDDMGAMLNQYGDRFPHRFPSLWDKDCLQHEDANNGRNLVHLHEGFDTSGNWQGIEGHNTGTDRGHAVDGHWYGEHDEESGLIWYPLWARAATTSIWYGDADDDGELKISDTLDRTGDLEDVYSTPTLMSPPGSDSDQWIAYNYENDDPDAEYYPPSILAATSDDFYYSYGTKGVKSYSSDLSGWFSLQSHIPLSHTFDPVSDTNIFVTVTGTELQRGGDLSVIPAIRDETSNEIKLGEGSILENNVSLPAKSGSPLWDWEAKTDFKPGVACGDEEFGLDYNCVLAWAPRAALDGQVLYTFFRYDEADAKIDWHGGWWIRGGSLTRGHVAAAFFDDTLWLAWKNWGWDIYAARSHWTGPDYNDWSYKEKPGDGENHPTAVDPPTFLYHSDAYEAVWTWTVSP